MAIFYLRNSKIEGNKLIITDEELLRHLRSVLRIKIGEEVKFFDNDSIYKVITKEILRGHAVFEVENVQKKITKPLNIAVAQAVIEKNELENAIRLLISATVQDIYIFKADRSNLSLNENKLNRLREIALNASEQSEVCTIPNLIYFENTDSLLNYKDSLKFALSFGSQKSIKDVVNHLKEKQITFLVGPEGGFSKRELELFSEFSIPIITLRSGVFRSQFAGAVAVLTTLELAHLLT